MNKQELTHFLKKELGVREVIDGNSGWLRCNCPVHGETRPSFGLYTGVEYHPSQCFVCGVSNLLSVTMAVLDTDARSANALIRKYGSFGSGLNKNQLSDLELPKYENRIQKTNTTTFEQYMIAPYEGKYLNVVRRRFDYEDDYLRSLRLGADKLSKRIVIPWFYKDKLVGVTGRHVYKNPHPEPKTLPYFGFKKGTALYLPTGRIRADIPFGIVEGEGDAINANRVYPNVGAVGSATLSATQLKILRSSGVSDLFIIRDPDNWGLVFAESVQKAFGSKYKIKIVGHPFKDAGDMMLLELRKKLKEYVQCL